MNTFNQIVNQYNIQGIFTDIDSGEVLYWNNEVEAQHLISLYHQDSPKAILKEIEYNEQARETSI